MLMETGMIVLQVINEELKRFPIHFLNNRFYKTKV